MRVYTRRASDVAKPVLVSFSYIAARYLVHRNLDLLAGSLLIGWICVVFLFVVCRLVRESKNSRSRS